MNTKVVGRRVVAFIIDGLLIAAINLGKRIGDIVASTLVVSKDSVGAAPAATGLEGDAAAPTWVEGTR